MLSAWTAGAVSVRSGVRAQFVAEKCRASSSFARCSLLVFAGQRGRLKLAEDNYFFVFWVLISHFACFFFGFLVLILDVAMFLIFSLAMYFCVDGSAGPLDRETQCFCRFLEEPILLKIPEYGRPGFANWYW